MSKVLSKDKKSEALAAIIVANRKFGIFKEDAREAMIELMIRSESGDGFDYDQYISSKLSEIPNNSKYDPLIKSIKFFSGIR